MRPNALTSLSRNHTFENVEQSARRCADETKCNSQFLTMVTQMKLSFLLPPHHAVQLLYLVHIPWHASLLTISSVLHRFL
jgi:hypothetical protein